MILERESTRNLSKKKINFLNTDFMLNFYFIKDIKIEIKFHKSGSNPDRGSAFEPLL
jgi:hypothetical protein